MQGQHIGTLAADIDAAVSLLKETGYTVQSKNDWRTAPPDKPGWWTVEYEDQLDRGFKTSFCWVDYGGTNVLRARCPEFSGVPVTDKMFRQWCPATFPTPPRTPEGV